LSRFLAWSDAETEALRGLVMDCWDPIGVHHLAADDSDRSAYWDEYDDYLPVIIGHLERGDSPRRLQESLALVRTRLIGLDERADLDAIAALTILYWYAHGRTPPSGDTAILGSSDAESFFARRGYRVVFVPEQRRSERGTLWTRVWVDLVPLNEAEPISRYALGGDDHDAALGAVARWRVEHDE
jgi:hypothetical protein